ncbi:MAG TPA: DUF3568 family protein [Planctomycetota bacterium]|nr:DUF3568 family protein [Planctomycetota bacterium]
MKRAMAIGITPLLLALLACQDNDLGSGVNTVDREFAKSVPQVWAAAVRSAETLEFTVTGDAHDKLEGELVARRAGGGDIHIWVKSLDERTTRVSVRVEPGDHALALVIQEHLADELGLGAAKAALFGGNALEGRYPISLDSAVRSAHHVFSTLQVTTTDEETHATWTRLDGRLRNSIPVRIKIEKDDARIRATFIAGDEDSDDTQAFVRRMKNEFESQSRTSTAED